MPDTPKQSRSMALTRAYRDRIVTLLDRLIDSQGQSLNAAQQWVAETWMSDRIVYVTGSGHSHILAEEVFYRAGGPAPVQAILDPGLMLHTGARRSSQLERVEGYAEVVLSDYAIGSGDVIFIASNSGRNAFPVEAALIARARGARVIAITALNHARRVTSRHSSGKLLHEVADLTIDNGGDYGDASIAIPGGNIEMGPTSTIAGVFILQAVFAEAVSTLVARGISVDVFQSANLQGNDTAANEIIDRWRTRIRGL